MRFALVLVLLFACNRADAPPVEIAPVALPSTSVAHEDPPDAAPQPANVAVATPSGQTDGPVLADPPPRAIQGVIAASRSKLRNCFNQKLKTDPNANAPRARERMTSALASAPRSVIAPRPIRVASESRGPASRRVAAKSKSIAATAKRKTTIL